MNRRSFLAVTAATAALAACATGGTSLPQFAQDAQIIAAGLTATFAQIQAQTPTLPAAVVAQVKSYLAELQAAAQVLASTAANAMPSASTIQTVVAATQGIATALLPLLPAGAPAAIAITAATTLLPFIMAAVTNSQVPSVTPAAKATAPLNEAAANQARLILRGMAAQ